MWDKLLLVLVLFLALVGLILVYNIFVNMPLLKVPKISSYAPVPVEPLPTFFKKAATSEAVRQIQN